ncbi:DUF262 domain-containing protein [Dyadobacter alkalitolerans]|uniref:DUF262 domain-containing protein n=1 Tax=Dyadobacter alkalitolerans TaxID=492736 RepID=UPI00040D50B3|nr:DUF262 domain-containing protein [Dyadobacter alkalitolerans]
MLKSQIIDKPANLLGWNDIKDRIDFQPSYQRKGNLWTKKMKSYFINTILNEYDFPKIYLADFTFGSTDLNEKRKQYAVIDGKQRLTTVFDFFEDKIQLDNTPIFFRDQILDLENFTYSDMKREYPLVGEIFDRFQPVIMGVYSDRPEDVYEMFIRLNINIAISGAERRNALPGPIPQLLRKIAIHSFFLEKIKFSIERGQDLNLAAKFLLLEISSKIVTLKKNELDGMVAKSRSLDEEVIRPYYQNVENVLNQMNDLFLRHDDLLASPTQIPIYYLLTKYYASRFSNFLDVRQFLWSFERSRNIARKELKQRSTGQISYFTRDISDDAISYNLFVRSPDDKKNIEGMLEILVRQAIEEGVIKP